MYDLMNKYSGDPNDLLSMNDEQLIKICSEIRWTILNYCSKHGGHLASNLGTIELTVAAYASGLVNTELPLTFDGAHCAYTHKILTGRWRWFIDQHQYLHPGISSVESVYDVYNPGFIGTSGVYNGICTITGKRPVIVIGDGALGNGVLIQALNIMASSIKPIIILNVNNVALTENIGGMYKNNTPDTILSVLGYTCIIDELNNDYVDGHNISALRKVFTEAKNTDDIPIYIPVRTIKGKGFKPAELDPSTWHAVNPFNLTDTTAPIDDCNEIMQTVSDVICSANDNVYAINAGLIDTGLRETKQTLGDRFIEVGIAEEQAAYTAVGLALRNKIPIIGTHALYTTRMTSVFANVALINGKLPIIILAIDIGIKEDNYLQMGMTDIQTIGNLPDCTIITPYTIQQLRFALEYAISNANENGLTLFRIPVDMLSFNIHKIRFWNYLKRGDSGVAVIAFSNAVNEALEIKEYNITLVTPLFINDIIIENEIIKLIKSKHESFILIEDGYIRGGLCERIALKIAKHNKRFKILGIKTINYQTMLPNTRKGILEQNNASVQDIINTITTEMIITNL